MLNSLFFKHDFHIVLYNSIILYVNHLNFYDKNLHLKKLYFYHTYCLQLLLFLKQTVPKNPKKRKSQNAKSFKRHSRTCK